jgi:3-hydroxymyristoyl/3-hydroxydecanoyl-(acyl carrier protein) dehydratase
MRKETLVATEPVVLDVRTSDARAELDLLIPETLLFFRGHFPGFPVLPGVVQLHWAIALGRQYFKLNYTSPEAVQVKFRSVIVPEENIRLVLGHDAPRRKLSFEYRDATGPRSSGVVAFAP